MLFTEPEGRGRWITLPEICRILHIIRKSNSIIALIYVSPFRSLFFRSPKITQPFPQVFSVNGSIICSRLHFWRHFEVIGSVICSGLHYWRHWLNNWSTGADYGELLVFSVTPFKIDQNIKSKPFNRLSPESANRKKVDIQSISRRFRSQQFFLWKICGETFSPNLWRFLWSTWAPTWRPETSRNISHWVLLQKREFISRRTQKRNNSTLF